MLRAFQGSEPRLPASAFVDPTAVVIGDVTLGEDASVWPQAVLRGDVQRIEIGARTNLQDGCIVHVTHDGPFSPGGVATVVGADVTVGHRVILHACSIGDLCLIGMGAIIMDRAVIESGVIVAAGALVPPGKVLESGYLYVGSPARCLRPLSEQEREHLAYSARHYVTLKNRHMAGG